MPPTVSIADNLFTWALTFADGSTRTVVGSNMQSVIGGVFDSAVVSVVRGAAFSADGGPAPVLSSLNPTTAVLGSANFTLHVIGTGFRPGVIISFAGQDEPTTYVSPTEVTTGVNMSMWHGPDPAIPVRVRTLGGQVSNTLNFSFTATE